MYKILRIIFTVCSAVCIAAAFPVAFFLSFPGLLTCALLAALFFGLMLLCKQSQELREGPLDEEIETALEEETTNSAKESEEKDA